MISSFLHYFSAGLSITLGGIGGGIGLGIAAFNGIDSLLRQPTGNDSEFRSMIIGMALIESGAIIALVATLVILIGAHRDISLGTGLAEMGMGLAVGITAATISIASSFVVKEATYAISRQPPFAQKIIGFMLLTQSIIEAPAIFAFVVALVIKTRIFPTMSFFEGLQAFSAGLVMAFGSLGPSIGQSRFAKTACRCIGLNKSAHSKIFPFTLLGEAVIETPVIFCLLISLMILHVNVSLLSIVSVITFFIAALTLVMGSLGGGIAIGKVTSISCLQLANDPSNYNMFMRVTLLAMAFIESAVIYALIVALLLVTRGPIV